MEPTQRSEKAFRFGLLGGRANGRIPPWTGPAIATVPDEPVEVQQEAAAAPEVPVAEAPPLPPPTPAPVEVQQVVAAAEAVVPGEALPPPPEVAQ